MYKRRKSSSRSRSNLDLDLDIDIELFVGFGWDHLSLLLFYLVYFKNRLDPLDCFTSLFLLTNIPFFPEVVKPKQSMSHERRCYFKIVNNSIRESALLAWRYDVCLSLGSLGFDSRSRRTLFFFKLIYFIFHFSWSLESMSCWLRSRSNGAHPV